MQIKMQLCWNIIGLKQNQITFLYFDTFFTNWVCFRAENWIYTDITIMNTGFEFAVHDIRKILFKKEYIISELLLLNNAIYDWYRITV